MIDEPSLKDLLKLSCQSVVFKIWNLGHIIQSQGKIERSHGTWITELRFDILNSVPGKINL